MAYLPRLPSRVKRELVRYLVLRYAPEVELRVVPGGSDRLHIADATDPDNYLIWDPREGLTLLLHELGHWNTQKQAELCETVIEEEAVAWKWAEDTARKENIWFDYARADARFQTYTRANRHEETGSLLPLPLRIAWQYRGVAS